MSNGAWVTLATNDSYGLGALVLAHSLRRVNSVYSAVVLITPSVTDAMRNRLSAVFSEVIVVDVLDSRDATHLALLQRPELGITFTKIHCWSLTQYEKCVFLDADALIVQNCDELFEREELSAAPDVGWPDCFNSGVFVYKPSQETFDALIKFAKERGSFDGGDQGLLNAFFSDWAHGDINKHLPFLYNVTSAAFYSYLPALKHYGANLKIIHFIGATKPWLQTYNWESHSVDAPGHLQESLQLWWNIFVSAVHPQLDLTMSGVAGNLARVVPGAPTQRDAIDELTRRQGWEAGNIDYMGADSFDNIWAKISQTLNQSPKQPTPPPKEPSPPKQPSPPKEQPVVPQPEPSPPKQPAPTTPVASVQSVPIQSDVPKTTELPVSKEETKSVVVVSETVKQPAPVETTKVEEKPKLPAVTSAPVSPSKSEPETVTPVSGASAKSTEEKLEEQKTPEKSLEASITSTDSPPLANTPSKEDIPPVPKSTEEAAQETRL